MIQALLAIALASSLSARGEWGGHINLVRSEQSGNYMTQSNFTVTALKES